MASHCSMIGELSERERVKKGGRCVYARKEWGFDSHYGFNYRFGFWFGVARSSPTGFGERCVR